MTKNSIDQGPVDSTPVEDINIVFVDIPPVVTQGKTLPTAYETYLKAQIFDFLSIIDIANTHERRAIVVALKLGEEGLKKKIKIAAAYIDLQTDYSISAGIQELLEESKKYAAKLTAMKQWLNI